MPDWLSYSPSDLLLFSPRTYYRLFELHNFAVWPAQLVGLAGGIAMLWFLHRGGDGGRGRIILLLLAAAWAFVGFAFLLMRYATINWAATYISIGFAIEVLLLLWAAVRGRLVFASGHDLMSRAGYGIFLLALLIQPLIAPIAGRAWLQAEIFGIAPDPTVSGTLGVLLTASRTPWELLVIPLIWCIIGGATLWTMGSPEAPVMPIVAALVLLLAAWKTVANARRAAAEPAERTLR